jgi:outer membrane protein insertion porin family
MSSNPIFPSSKVPMAIMLSSACTAWLWTIPSFAQTVIASQPAVSDSLSTQVTAPSPALPSGSSDRSNRAQLESRNIKNIKIQTIEPPSTNARDLLTASENSPSQDDRIQDDRIQFDGKLPPFAIADNTQDMAQNEVQNGVQNGPKDETNPAADKNLSNAQKPFEAYFGTQLPDPTALRGPTRTPIVYAVENIDDGFSISGGFQANLSRSLKLFLEGRGGQSVLGGDLSLFYGSDDLRSGVAVNVFNQRSFSPSFVNGTDVNLPNGSTPWVDRFGGGVEFHHPFGRYLNSAVGVTYQSVTIRDGIFGSDHQPIDQFGNRLAVSPSGRDDLLTANLALSYDSRDSVERPTRGTHLRFGLDQSIPVGTASIEMTRLSASASQFVPLPFFAKKSSTLVFNVQGGRIFGDVPPYEAFNLGGDTTVRGFKTGGVGTGSAFLQASVEYRFPLFSLRLLKQPIAVGGTVFLDYGTLLGTQNEVIGRPGIARKKPGDGFGYGAGVSFDTRFGLFRVGAGVSDRGDVEPLFSLTERF